MADSPHNHDRQAGYLAVMTTFGTALAATAAIGRLRGQRLPAAYALTDVALGAIATHKFARLLTKDGVTTPLRAPFTQFEENTGSGEVAESPRPQSARHVIGELVTCPFCVAPWIASSYVAALALAPRPARAWAAVFTMVAGADFLQHAYAHVRTD